MLLVSFFFFKQKTAYEMRISDWSSDVCSSDLLTALDEAIRANRLVQAKTLLEQSQLARQSGPMLDLLKAEYDLARGQNDVALAGFRLLVADIGVGARAHQGAGIDRKSVV